MYLKTKISSIILINGKFSNKNTIIVITINQNLFRYFIVSKYNYFYLNNLYIWIYIYINTFMSKPIPFEIFYKSAEILKVMAHPIRLAIIDSLISKGQLSVTEIYQHLDIEQSVISYHLKNMRLVNLVVSQRKGTKIFYKVEHQEVIDIFHKIIDLGQF